MNNKATIFMALLCALSMFNCERIPPGHRGVEVSWGGETNMNKIYGEGLTQGIHWITDDIVAYDCREQTIKKRVELNDNNNMETGIELAVDFRFDPERVNLLHSKITDIDAKIEKTIQSACKEVVPQYSAVDLNISKRQEGEKKLSDILGKEFPEFYVEFIRVQMTDVDIPKSISDQAELTAKQQEANKLAAEMAEEKTNLGNALVAEAKGAAEAAKYEAERLEYLTTPAMLKFKELEIKMEWAKRGVSPYGNNNVFGADTNVFKGFGGSK